MSAAPERQTPYDAIVFDLDDTLLDTSRYLVPVASRESCIAMVKAGLPTSVDACLLERESFMRASPRDQVYDHLARHFKSADPQAVAKAGFDAFYVRNVERDIHFVPGALPLLMSLHKRYKLYLLTAGNKATQMKKVEILSIADLFDEIFYIDPSAGESKETVFQHLAQNANPARLLSVGNRLDTDLAPAKKWSWQTCWVRYGEYRHMQPKSSHEQADFVVDELLDVASRCQL